MPFIWALAMPSNKPLRRPLVRALCPHLLAVLSVLVLLPGMVGAQQFMSTEQFLKGIFPGQVPAPKVVWLQGKIKERVEKVLGHRYGKLRVRYWQQGDTTAWILDEVGKEQPITVGIVVRENRIALLRVLAYRESRGDEVRHRFFTRQFDAAGITNDDRLDKPIDGITGATLSVQALTKLSRMALILHQHVVRQNP